MTSLTLSLWIAAAIGAQLLIYTSVAFVRHWKDYRSLHDRIAAEELPPIAEDTPAVDDSSAIPWSGFRTFRVVQKIFEDAARSVCSFHLVPDDGKPLPPFFPGQFLTFRLDLPTAAGESEPVIRCYSLSDVPRPDSYRISIKRVPPAPGIDRPPGRASAYFHDHVATGDRLEVRAPSGHFHIDHGEAPIVLIGSGIGITPLLSMLNWSLEHQEKREIWLFYGVRHGRELVMRQHLEALAKSHPHFHLHLCFSDPHVDDVPGRDYQHRGRIGVDLLRMQLPLKPYHYYICGPSAMMESLVPALEEWGVRDTHIHFEAFGPASISRGRPTAPPMTGGISADIVVDFSRSGKRLPWTPAAGSLLEFAEAHGVSIDSGCRAGGCGSCQTTIQSGEVAYVQPPDFDPEPGNCLLCVCTPVSSVTLEA